MKTRFLLFLLLIIVSFLNAQNSNEAVMIASSTTSKGTVVDKSDGTPLPYAYLKIDKTNLGTVTESDGKFKITIPKKYDADSITISYLGFENLKLKVADFKAKNGEIFALDSEAVSLKEVVLEKTEKLPKAKKLLKKVIKRIPLNYTSTPTLITGYYRETMKENGNYIKYTDAACDYYASPYIKKKYKWRDYQNPFDFSLSSGTFNFDSNSLHRIHFHHKTLKSEQVNIINSRSSGSLSEREFHGNIEGGPLGLFARNRVKYQESFLGKKATRDFTYKISEELDDQGNWLYVLDFHTKTTKADLDALASPDNNRNRRQWNKANKRKLLKGRIYINQEDLAVVRYECAVPNQLKEYFCGYKFNQVKHFDYKLDVRFKKKDDHYYMDNMRHEDEFIYKDSTSQATTYYSAISEFKATNISTQNVKKISKDENFANTMSNQLYDFSLDYDSDFWQDYTTKNTLATIDSTIRKDMEFEKPLEKQFRDKHIRNDSMATPIAKIEPSSFKIHGKKYTDNYAWLKDTKAPKNNKPIMDYLRQENKYTDNYNIPLKKAQRNIYKELVKSIEKNSTSLPIKDNGYFYYSKFNEDDEHAIYYRKAVQNDAIEEELLNVNIRAKEKDYYTASVGSASPNNELIGVYENTTGTDAYVLKFKDLKNQTFLTDSINRIGGMVWLDNTTFLYVNVEKQTFRSSKIMRHVLGTDTKSDVIIYEEKDPSFNVGIQRSKSKDYIFLSTSSSTSSETWFLKTDDPTGEFKVIQPREKNHLYGVSHHKNQFYIVTNKDALNYKVVTVDVENNSKEKWKDIIPHQPGVLLQGFQVFDNYLVINEKENAQSRIKIINQTTQKSHFITLKEEFYNIGIGYNPDFATDSLQFSYSSFEMPTTTFRYNMETKKKRLVKQHSKPIEHPFYTYVVERKWVTAKDGKLIPLTLISHKWRAKRKGFNDNGKVYLTSYGSYGSGQGLAGGPKAHHLVNSGYVYAIAHIRGGDDMGKEWYEDGKLLNKKNTFTDFIACADYLITEGYAKEGSIVAEGGSAGGLLMGAVVNERPELFNMVILNVPFVDVINTMLDENLPLTVSEFEEWGNPKNKKDYEYIKSYSPYDNVKVQTYPNLLFFTGLNDTRVGYWEPAKMVAKLRATKTDDNLLLLKTDFSNGHGGGSGRFAGFRDSAYILALIYDLYRSPKSKP
jgi:protease II